MQAPTVSQIRIGDVTFPIKEFYPEVGKRIALFAGVDDHFKPIIDKGYITKVYSNNSFEMSDDPLTKITKGVVEKLSPKNPRIYDSTYRYLVAGA
jgi:hypothetical protein